MTYDIAVIGAGVSAAYTLTRFLELLRETPPAKPVRVVVIEKSGEFWAGVPYGRRSGQNSLIITALNEFLPEPERRAFARWLDRHWEEVIKKQDLDGRQLSSEWRRRNAAALAAGQWDDLFVPRRLFGIYLRETMRELLSNGMRAGLVAFDLITADVQDVERTEGRYRLSVCEGDAAKAMVLIADKVMLALGSPPNRTCCGSLTLAVQNEVCIVDNVYEPGLDENLARVDDALKRGAARGRDHVLVVGSNASALEVLYNLMDRSALADRVGKFLIVSSSGRFPYRIGSARVPADYRAGHLEALLGARPFTAHQILESLERDVEAAEQQGINVAAVFHLMSRGVLDALNALDSEEQERFVTDYGVRIGKLQRRAGPEYLDVVAGLLAGKRLKLLKGEFVRYVPELDGGSGFEYLEPATRMSRALRCPLAAIINCGGFLGVDEWESPLVRNLIRRGLCRPNASKRGFLLNEYFESSPECYVMGPLVAGNLNRAMRVWHAESCSRIIALSRQLAQSLMRPFCTPEA